jgi:hypothetical protein
MAELPRVLLGGRVGPAAADAGALGQQLEAAAQPDLPDTVVVQSADGHVVSQGAAQSLAADVRALVEEVFAGPAPAMVARVEAYLWQQGARTFR